MTIEMVRLAVATDDGLDRGWLPEFPYQTVTTVHQGFVSTDNAISDFVLNSSLYLRA
jgi:hypothetical protein